MVEREIEIHRYDPALAESEANASTEELALVVRVSDRSALPEDVRVVTTFGDVMTVRVASERLQSLADCPAAVDMESARIIAAPETAIPLEAEVVIGQRGEEDTSSSRYTRRPDGLRGTGRGVVVGVIDWGIDFVHGSFRHAADGSTRMKALWDMRGGEGGGPENRWGYGRVFSSSDIDRALATSDPYGALGYHPADADVPDPVSGRRPGAHGSHVAGIAAGSEGAGILTGVAPGSDLVFVHLAQTNDVLGRANLGDSASLLEAIDFVFETAEGRPAVVNLSVGAHGGPKDGSTLVERGIDQAIRSRQGRVVVCSVGNYAHSGAHRLGRLAQDEREDIHVLVPHSDPTRSEIEIWYAGNDRFTATVLPPDESVGTEAGPGADGPILSSGALVGHIYHVKAAGNGAHHVDVFLRPGAPGGLWTLRLSGDYVEDGRYRAYIERERGLRPSFRPPSPDPRSSTGSICNGLLSISVGAYDPHERTPRLARFSSRGPTADGRVKPDLVAPGVQIVAAKSNARGEANPTGTVQKSGTSMAAPHVAGTLAVMFEAAGQALEGVDVRALLLSSTDRSAFGPEGYAAGGDVHGFGSGILDSVAAEDAARRWSSPAQDAGESEVLVNAEVRTDEPNDGPRMVEPAADEEDGDEARHWRPNVENSGVRAPDGPDVDVVPHAGSQSGAHGQVDDIPGTQGSHLDDVSALAEPPVDLEGFSDALLEVSAGADISDAGMLREVAFSLNGNGPGASLNSVLNEGSIGTSGCRPGDILVRAAPAQGIAYEGIVIGRRAEPAGSIAARGVPVETAGPGLYVEVAEIPVNGGRVRRFGRRLVDPWGRLPSGQSLLRPSNDDGARQDDYGEAAPAFIAIGGMLISAANLGLGVFDRFERHALSGAFSVVSHAANYVHKPSPTGLTVHTRTFSFAMKAHHPRIGIGTQTLWFRLTLEYDGLNIRRVSILEDLGRSSVLVSSAFNVSFTPLRYSAENEPIAAIAYDIRGVWDPIGRGEESFGGRILVDAQGRMSLNVFSSRRWVWAEPPTATGGGRVPTPTTAEHKTAVEFDRPGGTTLNQAAIRKIHQWYQALPEEVKAEAAAGRLPIRLTARASTTASVHRNQVVSRARANSVSAILRDIAGSAASLVISAHGELGARTRDAQEDPSERRVDICVTYQVYR